jgi:CubicO group peptidase (beta-lactamase class C family)
MVGTGLAAFIIQRLAGISFEEYVQDKILNVLNIDEKKGGYRLSHFQESNDRSN